MADKTLVRDIRAASRDLVRGFGFMNRTVAGSDLSASAAHAVIEIGLGDGTSARTLCNRLLLDKSTVSRLVARLVERGLVRETPSPVDSRVKLLSLTEAGQEALTGIDAYADAQAMDALERSGNGSAPIILAGLRSYADALTGRAPRPVITYGSGYRVGLGGRMTELCSVIMNEQMQFGRAFEARVGGDVAEFLTRIDNPLVETWWAAVGDRVLGMISIDGEALGKGFAHLRWFVVDKSLRGSGVGAELLRRALDFADTRGFRETHLWTVQGLDAARALYDRAGFTVTEEYDGDQWGSLVTEHKMVRLRPQT